ncbi:NUDIX hydrolase [Aliiroseovarius sp.]|uniref:NUDIX hydrolase n=1 Tax=Aliiroseovarius sp. TaxID=1872442 RepID=UPI003BAC667E
MGNEPDFSGAKLVCLIGDRLLTLLRDDRPDIPYPDHWDLPGGGREGAESAEACVLRETREEFGLHLTADALAWRRWFHSPTVPGTCSAWFAARLPAGVEGQIRFGNEGQRWALMDPDIWLDHDKVVPHFPARVREALAGITQALENKG